MLYRNEILDLLFESTRTSDHRFFGYPIVKKNFWHIGKLPSVFQGAEPEIPIFKSLDRHRAIVAAILFPNRTPVEGGGVDIIPAQQLVRRKWADKPAVAALSEALRIPIDSANLRIRVQDSNSTVYPARPQAVVGIQGKYIFTLGSKDAGVSRRR